MEEVSEARVVAAVVEAGIRGGKGGTGGAVGGVVTAGVGKAPPSEAIAKAGFIKGVPDMEAI